MAPRENGGDGDFAGIDPVRMRAMIKDLADGKAAIEAMVPALKEPFEKVGLSTKPIAVLTGIAAWIGDELPMLNRRRAMAEQLAKEDLGRGPRSGMVPGESPGRFAGAAEAEAKARELAARYREPGLLPAEVWTEIAASRRDPDFAAAFLKRLGPEQAAEVTAHLRDQDGPDAAARLETFATLTATASHQGVLTEQWLQEFGPQGRGPDLYGLGALIAHGIWDAATLRAIGAHALKSGHLLGGADVAAEILDAIARDPLAAHELYEANFDRINDMAAGTVPGWDDGDGPKGDALGRFLTAATVGAYEVFERKRPATGEEWANPADPLIKRMVDAVDHGPPSPFAGVREAHAKAVRHLRGDLE